MNSKNKTKNSGRLPSLYGQTLLKSEYDYRREIRRKLDQIQHDNHGLVRRRRANDHVFANDLLKKRYQWFTVDKSYRDTCRTIWSRPTESGRASHIFLPSVYTPDNSTPLTMASVTTLGSHGEDDEEENTILTDERIKQDFLRVQPVMLEILRAPHSSKVLKYKQQLEIRKKSAQKRQFHIQTTATNDNRYTELVSSLQEV